MNISVTFNFMTKRTRNGAVLKLLLNNNNKNVNSKRNYGESSPFKRAFSASSNFNDEEMLRNPRILITGAMGQLGQGLAKILRRKYGRENVIMSDVVKLDKMARLKHHDPYLYLDVLDQKSINSTVVNYQIDWVVHFSALLSAVGENNVPKALKLNVDGVNNVLEASRQFNLRIFVPSTIGAFGPTSPRVKTPDVTIQRPKTIYGVTKVYNELIGEYYNTRFGVDFRCLRLPGVISGDTQPGGGTTDYAVQIFHDALDTGRHVCYLEPNTRLPMIYIDDCLGLIAEFMETAEQNLKLRTYNATAMSFTPDELFKAIQKRIPSFKISYEICPVRQAIADSWPQSLDDSGARKDWGWAPSFDLNAMVDRMLQVVAACKNEQHKPPSTAKASSSSKY